MARETKAERLAREAQEAAQFRAEREVTYPTRLMNVLNRAQAANFEVLVQSDMTFQVYDRDERDPDRNEVDYFYSEAADSDLDDLEREVSWKEEKRAEEHRKYLVKQNALAKLNAEERELLNL